MKFAHLTQDDADEYVFVAVECPGRPAVAIDFVSSHGRRTINVRVDGTTMFGALIDVKELGPAGGKKMRRYCQFCGEELQLSSSGEHECGEEKEAL